MNCIIAITYHYYIPLLHTTITLHLLTYILWPLLVHFPQICEDTLLGTLMLLLSVSVS